MEPIVQRSEVLSAAWKGTEEVPKLTVYEKTVEGTSHADVSFVVDSFQRGRQFSLKL